MEHPLKQDIDFFGDQSIGLRRDQQDSFAVQLTGREGAGPQALLLVVADGMGGYKGGKEASSRAVQGFLSGFFDPKAKEFVPHPPQEHLVELLGLNKKTKTQMLLRESGISAKAGSSREVFRALARGLFGANAAVESLVKCNPAVYDQAGTTLLAAVASGQSLLWISVGDSPLFLWRGGKLTRVNEDHSMHPVLLAMVEAGELDPSELATHPQRNMLISALIGLDIELVDNPETPLPMRSGDILVAASDGIITLSPSSISALLRENQHKTAKEITELLLAAVEEAEDPFQDNTTVAVFKHP